MERRESLFLERRPLVMTEVNIKKGQQGKISFFVFGDDLKQKNF